MSAISVILLDDDPFIREVVSAALGMHPGVRVQGFAAAADALPAAVRAPPDVIVLDYAMPGADGLAVLGELRRTLAPLPPVVFLTARDDAALVARLRAAGAADVLAKPFDPLAIAAQILRHARPTRVDAPGDARLAAVAAGFRASLPQTMAEIACDWGSLNVAWQRSVAESLLGRVHKLAGSAGLFGLHQLGDAARAVEAAVLAQIEGGAPNREDIAPAMAKLREAAKEAAGEK